jgi:hypothetical protein
MLLSCERGYGKRVDYASLPNVVTSERSSDAAQRSASAPSGGNPEPRVRSVSAPYASGDFCNKYNCTPE